MKVYLSTAKMAATVLVLALSALAGTNAMGATSGTAPPASAAHGPQSPAPVKSFKLKCAGFGEKEVVIANFGDAPVPAGTVVEWQIPKTAPGDRYTYSSANNGVYTFKSPLVPEGQIHLDTPPPSAPSIPGDPSVMGWGLTFLRPCTIGVVGPIRGPVHVLSH
jgi:hypothetical protein